MDENVTTEEKVSLYEAGLPAFERLLHEMRELSKKKADATLSAFKVSHLNRVLEDMLAVVEDQPEAKYVELLTSESLPQNSDAVLVMCQYEAALAAFKRRYFRNAGGPYSSRIWHTNERLSAEFDVDEDDEDADDWSDADDDGL